MIPDSLVIPKNSYRRYQCIAVCFAFPKQIQTAVIHAIQNTAEENPGFWLEID